MAIHFVRDYVTQNIFSANRGFIPTYLLGIFLRRVLLYTYVGDTNFGINAIGPYLIATADSTPSQNVPTFATGTRAGINQGPGREFYVWVPPSVRNLATNGSADLGRLLSLRSTANSTFNSGIYLITGFEALNLNVLTTSGTGVSPIQVQTTTTNTLTTGQTVTIASVGGNTNANGTFTITVLNNTTFTLNGTTGNGNYTTGGTVQTNTYIIDYRTMGVAPPQEPFDSMNWYLYEKDSGCPTYAVSNSTWPNGYGSSGTYTGPRIILQSPHPLGWQVRVCNEGAGDINANNVTYTGSNGWYGNVASSTAIPGFGGNVAGDFAVGGPHLHTAQWYGTFNNANAYTAGFAGTTPGWGTGDSYSASYFGANVAIQYRITIAGDDSGQAVAMFGRREFDPTNPRQWYVIFGLPDNEPTPLPVNNVARLFVIGSGQTGFDNNNFGNDINDISWSMGPVFFTNGALAGNNECQGMSQSLGGIPVACSTSLWTYTTGANQFQSPIFDGSAGDSPWLNATELTTVDIINGTVQSWSGQTNPTPPQILPLEPRIIGTIPLLRAGRTNFGEFALTTDGQHSWQHMRRGIYLTWNGPVVVP